MPFYRSFYRMCWNALLYSSSALDGKRNNSMEMGTFRRIARIVKTICGINLALKRYINKTKVTQWVANLLKKQADLDKELLFNIHSFTKKKNERDSAKLKSLLYVSPLLRSKQELALIQSLLRKNRTFQVLPHNVQLEVCQAAVYQQYETQTVIVREGHQPESCYFVLTGKMAAKSNEFSAKVGSPLTEILHEIEEGDLFGEATLLTNRKRPVTVVCKTDVELLLLNKSDFTSTLGKFLQQRYNGVIDLLRSLPIFTPWSLENLLLLSHSCLLRHYRSGTAVILESHNSSFIVVVKSGRCDIVTNLRMGRRREVLAQQSAEKGVVILKDVASHSLAEEKMKCEGPLLQRPATSPGFPLVGGQEATNIQQKKKLRPSTMPDPSTCILMESCFCDLGHEATKTQVTTLLLEDHKASQESRKQEEPKKDPLTPKVKLTESSQYKFLKIGVLEQGGVFGLTDILSSLCDLRLSLVSEGAECIFIPKKLFLEEAPAKSKQIALELVNTYPNERRIRESYARQHEWNCYKTRLIGQLLGDRARLQPTSANLRKMIF